MPVQPPVSLTNRDRQAELMDEPGLDVALHRSALNGLRRINLISRSSAMLWPAVRDLAEETRRPLRLLDLACGGGDVGIRLVQTAARHRIDLHLTGCDLSRTAISVAEERAKRCGVNANFIELDVFNDRLPEGHDVVCCSLFLHHLDEFAAVGLLRRMADAARHLVLVNDLVRSRIGFAMAWMGCHFLTRSPIVHVDGPRSVRAAFTPDEVRALATRAGLADVQLTRHWPERFLLRWRRP